jgi:hypothetical protein
MIGAGERPDLPVVPGRVAIEDDPIPNLFSIERGLRELESTGGQAALLLREKRLEMVAARKALREARARAQLSTDNPGKTIPARNAWVDLRTGDAQFEFELSEVEVKYAADLVDERSSTRSSLQTRAKLAMEVMRLAGYAGSSPTQTHRPGCQCGMCGGGR